VFFFFCSLDLKTEERAFFTVFKRQGCIVPNLSQVDLELSAVASVPLKMFKGAQRPFLT
jgi:hypothetical protein